MGSDMAGWTGTAAPRAMLHASARPLKWHEAGMVISDWSALMAAAQSGDKAAYHRLLTEAGARLRRYYERRLPPGIIDNAVQEASMVQKRRDGE